MVVVTGRESDREDIAPTEAEALFKEAKRRERRRRIIRIGVVVAVMAVVASVAYGTTRGRGLPIGPPGAGGGTAGAVGAASFHATDAFVVDDQGLVPVDLRTDAVGRPIAVNGLGDSTQDAVGAPDGKVAYVVSLPTPTRAGVDEVGPALVPVNLVSHTLGRPIAFRATAVSPVGTGSPAFDIAGLAITPNGRTVLIADAADSVVIPIDVATRRVGRPIPLPFEPAVNSFIVGVLQSEKQVPKQPADIGAIAVGPGGTTAYVTDGYTVVPLSLTGGRAERPITGFNAASQIAVAPDGRVAYVTNPYCWESIKNGDCVARPSRPEIEPNGKIQLAAVGQYVAVVDLGSERIERNIDVGKFAQPMGVAVAPDGAEVYVTYGQYGPYGSSVAVIDARTGRVERRIPLRTLGRGEGVGDIAVSPRGGEAFVSAFVASDSASMESLRSVIPVNLVKDLALPPVSLGLPASAGVSTGAVIFGQ